MTVAGPFVIPPFEVPEVRVEDVVAVMDVMEDVNPIHVDEELARSLGLRGCVNQGPANLAYVANMLMAWAGSPEAIRHLKIRFLSISCPGDRLEARGTVTEVLAAGGTHVADCVVELVRTSNGGETDDHVGEERVLVGTATVEVSESLAARIGSALAS